MNTTGNCKINFKDVTDNGVTKGVTYINSSILRVDQLFVDRVFLRDNSGQTLVPEQWAEQLFGHEFHNSLIKVPEISNVTISDDRLKHNEVNIMNALDTINKLKAQTYDMTSDLKTEDFRGELEEGTYRTLSGFISDKKYIKYLN